MQVQGYCATRFVPTMHGRDQDSFSLPALAAAWQALIGRRLVGQVSALPATVRHQIEAAATLADVPTDGVLPVRVEHRRPNVGRVTSARVDHRGLHVHVKLDDTAEGQRAAERVERGELVGFSLGSTPMAKQRRPDAAHWVTMLALREVSLTRDPADVSCTFGPPSTEGRCHVALSKRDGRRKFEAALWEQVYRHRAGKLFFATFGRGGEYRDDPVCQVAARFPVDQWSEEQAVAATDRERFDFYPAGSDVRVIVNWESCRLDQDEEVSK